MNVSTFDLFKLGIGPSSSHTMGPMTAAHRFLERLGERSAKTARVEVALYASLALTGRGHATDRAVILGLAGFEPRGLDPDAADRVVAQVREAKTLSLGGRHEIGFDEATDLLWEGRTRLPQHPNGLKFTAFDSAGEKIAERTYFSIGGGFVRDEGEMGLNTPPEAAALVEVPYPFDSGEELLELAAKAGADHRRADAGERASQAHRRRDRRRAR
jgi:L-serine dehydratase